MYTNKFSNLSIFAIAFFFALSLPTFSNAQVKSKSPNAGAYTETSPEMKKDMADMKQKMADCMKTEKSKEECHKEAMKDCHVSKSTGKCAMMEGMNMDKEMSPSENK